MEKKVAEQIVEMLAEAGVRRIYAVTGDSLNQINDAVRRNGKIEWIHVRNEETGAFAAGAEAQLHGGLACCAGSSGPGHVHLINGLYDAHRSGASVIAIASTIVSEEFGTRYFQETNTLQLFNDCSFYNELAVTPEQAPRMLQAAMQKAVTHKGVAVLGVPGDLASAAADKGLTSPCVFPAPAEICPSSSELQQLASLLNHSVKVTLFCGIGAKDAHDELLELAGLLNAPVAYSFKSKMEIQYDNPYEVGMTGLLGMPSGYESMHKAEVLLLLGTDFPYASFMPEHNTIVQVDVRPERLGRRAKIQMGLCGDIKTTLRALIPLIEPHSDDSFLKSQLENYAKVKKRLNTYVEERGSEERIHPEYVMSVINGIADEEAIFTVDTGMTCVWGARYLQATGKRKMLGSFNHGSMANAMPQAIGVALAYPGRQVVALCGDGGVSMLLGDLSTIVQYHLPVKILVFNNRALGMVKLEMEVAGLPDWQTDMLNPDYSRVAEAMGIPGYIIQTPGEVLPVLKEALKREGPVLVDMMTDPDALAMPPKVEWAQMTGFVRAMYKLLINGKSQEIIDTIHSNFKHIREVL